ncbi:embryonic protein UVS.2-like [Engystomops pustulosus]|uniref:embryonic protein UVS.2-like n=1 Tax=Engystomops pustulosus TaxID=76066 RepID=UPI003AFAE73C
MAAQTLSLQTPKCMSYGVVQHETMHALSFFHEHSRMDRDKYVDIMWQYISPQNQGDFIVENGQTMDIPYNYNSIMHYSRNTFSNTSGMPSIVPKPDPSVFIGQRNGLSALDVVMINRFYDCNLCRTKILGTSGSFSSSDASPSKANDNCLWLIHVVSFKVYLQLNFFTPSSDDCSDHIIVYDGVNKTSPVLVNISLNQPPPVLISSGVFMLVEYIADKSCSNSFSASYRTVSFGRTYTSSTGSVLSQKHPSNYPNNIKDTSIIIAPPGYKVSLTFALIDLELSPDCANDYLVLRDGGNTNSPIIGKYCGQKNKFRLLSSERMVLFQFSSNSSISRQGYRANYSFVLSK